MRQSLKLQTTVKFQNYIAILFIYVVSLPIATSLQPFPQKCLTHSSQVPYLTKVYQTPQSIPHTKIGAKRIQR